MEIRISTPEGWYLRTAGHAIPLHLGMLSLIFCYRYGYNYYDYGYYYGYYCHPRQEPGGCVVISLKLLQCRGKEGVSPKGGSTLDDG